jgi:hypothetical protein
MPWGVSPRIVTNTTTSHFDTGRGVLVLWRVGLAGGKVSVDAEMVRETGNRERSGTDLQVIETRLTWHRARHWISH